MGGDGQRLQSGQLGRVQARRYCFTINNYTEQELSYLRRLDSGRVRYLVCGEEVGETGTRHLQGYVELLRPTRPGGVKKILGTDRAHIEVSAGSSEQNYEYCTKEGQFFEVGDQRGGAQGKRTDLDEVTDIIRSGGSARDVLEHCGPAFIKYCRGIERAIYILASPREWPTGFIWRFGATGTGKSRDTHAESQALCPESVAWLGDVSLQWFDGWVPGSKGAVLDEFDGTAKLPLLLRILDRYPLKVPVKGGFLEWNCRILFITSQYAPEAYYGGYEQFSALKRRIRDFGIVEQYGLEGKKRIYYNE